MIKRSNKLDYFENIHSIPGIGKLSTAMIIGRLVILSDLNQINNSTLLGIDIKRYQSDYTHCRDTINKRGNKKRENFYFG